MTLDSHPLCALTPADTTSIESQLRLAADPTTDPLHLKHLAQNNDRRIRELIAGNPNAPTELLLELGAEFPEQLLNNPVFPLLCLGELNEVDKIPLKTLCSLLQQPNVPEFVFEWGVKTGNSEAIGYLGMNPHTPKAILERLVQTSEDSDEDSDFEQVAKLHVNWDGEITEGEEAIANQEIERCFERYDSLVFKPLKQLYEIAEIGPESLPDCVIEQQAIAADPETPRRLLESLSCSEHFEIRLAVAANPSTPSEILAQLAQEQQDWIQQAIAENPNTSPQVLTQLATDEQSVAVLKAIALHPETPLPILEHLVSSKYPRVTQGAIANLYWETNCDPQWKTLYHNRFVSTSPDLPSHLWQNIKRMAAHPDPEIRRKLAAHPKTPSPILYQLAHDPDIRVRLAVVYNPGTPVTIFGEFIYPEGGEQSSKRDNTIQIKIARHPNTHSRLLTRLAKHSDSMIRAEVWCNPHTSPQCLIDLAHQSKYVWPELYSPPHPPFKALGLRLDAIIERICENCPRLYNHPMYVLSYRDLELIEKFFEIARRYVARFPEGLPWMLESCSKPTVPSILRLLAVFYPKIRTTAFENYTPSAIWIERYYITQHPHTPTSLLEQLAHDGNRIVRAAAKARLQGHPGPNLHSWIRRWK